MQACLKNIEEEKISEESSIHFKGVGAHSGQEINFTVHISDEYGGIFFKTNGETIKASWKNVISTHMCTVIGNDHACVGTVEHLLSALRALDIYSALIEIDNKEVPILDGSSLEFYDRISNFMRLNQIRPQETKRIRVLQKVSIENEKGFVSLEPSEFSEFTAALDGVHPHPSSILAGQKCYFNFAHHSYEKVVALARTFGFKKDAQKLYDLNLAKGVSLDNAVVIDEERILNREGLRVSNEFAAHKVLDAIGDLSLAEKPILGHYKALNAGHTLNHYLLQKLFSDPRNYRVE